MIESEYSNTVIPKELGPNPGSTPQECCASLFIVIGSYFFPNSTALVIAASLNAAPPILILVQAYPTNLVNKS
jgi:hypothetical protein